MGKVGNRKYPQITREGNLIKNHGITEEAYDALYESQQGCCKICGSRSMDKIRDVLAVDHDHVTGRIRGLLCSNCNMLLGHAKDNTTTLLKAIQYLKGNL